MSLWPSRRLVAALAGWTALSLGVVLAPGLALPAAVALLSLLAWTLWDARLAARLSPLEIERLLPERAYIGRATPIRLLLHNRNDRDLCVSLLDEVAADLRPADAHFDALRVPAGRCFEVDYSVQPRQRGDRPFGALVLLVRSPFGWWWRRSLVRCEQALRVYPDTLPLLQSLNPQRMLAALGVRPVARRGAGMELESLRDYVPGDEPRRIDWAASARRGRAVIRQYQQERNHTLILALDASRLLAAKVDQRTKLDFIVDAALALAYAGLVFGDRVGVAVFDDSVRAYLAPRAHRRAFAQLVDVLRALEPRLVEPDYRTLARQLLVMQRQRALVVVLSDFVEAAGATLTEPLLVLAERHRVLLVATRDRLYREDSAETDGDLAMYRRLVINDLLNEREAALARLRRGGLQTLDVFPEQLTAMVLNRYLAMRSN